MISIEVFPGSLRKSFVKRFLVTSSRLKNNKGEGGFSQSTGFKFLKGVYMKHFCCWDKVRHLGCGKLYLIKK